MGALDAMVGDRRIGGRLRRARAHDPRSPGRDFGIGVILWSAPAADRGLAQPRSRLARDGDPRPGQLAGRHQHVHDHATPGVRRGDGTGLRRGGSALIAGMALGSLAMPLMINTIGLRSGLFVLGVTVSLHHARLARRPEAHRHRHPRAGRAQAHPVGAALRAAAERGIERLARCAERVTVAAGEEVFHAGDSGDRFFVIDSGEAQVIITDELREGDQPCRGADEPWGPRSGASIRAPPGQIPCPHFVPSSRRTAQGVSGEAQGTTRHPDRVARPRGVPREGGAPDPRRRGDGRRPARGQGRHDGRRRAAARRHRRLAVREPRRRQAGPGAPGLRGRRPAGRICLDVGASTGGFTHCLLELGATRVYAVDVGHGQLDAKLRADGRVVVMEKTNARQLSPTAFVDAARARDRRRVVHLAREGAAGHLQRAGAGGRGRRARQAAVRDRQGTRGQGRRGARCRAPSDSARAASRASRCCTGGTCAASPARRSRGPKGNREFFLHVTKTGRTLSDLDARIAQTAEADVA